MKHLKTYEKYIHTEQDKIDDMKLIEKFASKFEEMFEYRLDIIEKSNPEFRDYVGYGADIKYYGEVETFNKKYYQVKRKIEYKIRITTDINPNGITSEKDIGRTFTIDFDIKHKPRSHDKTRDFYAYSTNMNDVIKNFDKYVLETLNIKYLTPEEIEVKKIKKNMKKYNI
jgi:hypothetical protein